MQDLESLIKQRLAKAHLFILKKNETRPIQNKKTRY